MFTGIVEELGEVVRARPARATRRVLAVRGPLVTSDARHGDSIAVNGVCLTVVDIDGDIFTADVMERDAATAARSARCARRARSTWSAPPRSAPGSAATWCRATSTASARSSPASPADAWEDVRFALPPELARYVVEKGSITVDGVSLTVDGGRRRRVRGRADPDHARADHARAQGRRRPGQPGGRRDRQVRREAAGRHGHELTCA